MTAPRFFYPITPNVGTLAELPPALAHHAVRVLRLKHNTPVVLFDGQNGQYHATLILENKQVFVKIHSFEPRNVELAGQLTLAQALVSADKMDWIIEKAVESGVHTFVPVKAHRSVATLNADRLEKKILHWEKVIESASAQCGRNQLMQLEKPQSLASLLENATSELTLVGHPNAQQTLHDVLTPDSRHITVLIGPEGGWSDDELALASRANVQTVRFGKRVLRTETAGLAMVAAISALQNWE